MKKKGFVLIELIEAQTTFNLNFVEPNPDKNSI